MKYMILLLVITPLAYSNNDCCGAQTLTFKYFGDKWRPESCSESYCDVYGASLVGDRYHPRSGVVCQVRVCGDGLAFQGAFCSKGPCDVFGCNCEKGCVPGDAVENFKRNYAGQVYDVKLQPIV